VAGWLARIGVARRSDRDLGQLVGGRLGIEASWILLASDR
jgi:hypothetical protein